MTIAGLVCDACGHAIYPKGDYITYHYKDAPDRHRHMNCPPLIEGEGKTIKDVLGQVGREATE